jgi:hypothetical protein
VDHPSTRIAIPDAYEQGQQRTVGSLLTDSLGALSIAPLGVRVELAGCTRIATASVVSVTGCLVPATLAIVSLACPSGFSTVLCPICPKSPRVADSAAFWLS